MRIFRRENSSKSRDILKIAFSLFEAEKSLKDGFALDTIRINLSLTDFDITQDKSLISDIELIFKEILNSKVKLDLYVSSNKEYRKSRTQPELNKSNTLCLCSGGVDSFFGILDSKEVYPNLQAVFIAHNDQTGMINIFNSINKSLLKKYGIKTRTIHVPSIRPKKNKHGYSQLRGLLYILSCGALLETFNGVRIVITECGSTMYQPLFGIYDSITHTTHPLILKTSNEILSKICKRKIQFIIPYENMTKAEIIAHAKNPEHLPSTHSCITSRFRDHCGVCYGCVLRRLGAILVGVKDADYRHDIFWDNEVDDDNLISLLRFSYYFLFDRQKLPSYSLEKIKKYSKWDLFERQSLDVLSALYVLKKDSYPLSKRIQKAYQVYIEPVEKEILEKRIKIVRQGTMKPDFNKIL